MFEYIVEDPFYSPHFDSIITVKDDGRIINPNGELLGFVAYLTQLRLLYEEWLNYNVMDDPLENKA
jgi:hypothetical protein